MKSRVAVYGMFTALALIFSYIESLIPISFATPGIKLGLANLIIVIGLYKLSVKEVVVLSVVRVVLSGFLFGNMFAIFYSLAGGLLSLGVMAFLKKQTSYSVIGVSLMGGVFHNVGQLIIAMIVVESFQLVFYLPILLIAGMVTGGIIGVITKEMLRHLASIKM